METLKPANKHIQLRENEATLLMLVFDSGMIHLQTHQMTNELVFGHKANSEQHKVLMEKLGKLQAELVKQLFEKKSSIITKV